ncbi:MAG: DNA repair protein RadA [Myxococcota bacterium]
MAKTRSQFVCQACGHIESKWLGRCPACQTWSSLVEELAQATTRSPPGAASRSTPLPLSQVTTAADSRRPIGITELDRVLGGGLVEGSLVLVGGDPGIGKSTLLLQAVGALAQGGARALYATAEESLRQVKLRADRLGVTSDNLYLLAETRIEAIDEARRELQPTVLVIDSIQTVGLEALESAVGSVAQIRGVTQRLMEISKGEGVATFIVAHVTKEGTIAGPKVMEHMVDTVLYFEGERTGPYRILRAHKNRFGSAQEIGVFEMEASGLTTVANPSQLFLSQRADGPGAVVVTSLEGSRPILLEVQALTTASLYGTPRRTAIGFEPQRVAMLCAVLERRAGIETGGLDVYVNVAGGVKISEPAADLGVVLALASAHHNLAVSRDTMVVGEVGLAGEVRAAAQLAARVQEAARLGFSRCVVPAVDLARWRGPAAELPLVGVATVDEALREVGLR